MPLFPLSLRPALGALILALLTGVSPTRAAWTPPTTTQPDSGDDAGNNATATVTPTPSTSGSSPTGSTTSGGTLTVSSAGSYSSSSSSASISAVNLNASSYSGGTLTLVGSNYYTGATSTLGGYYLTSGGSYLSSGTLVTENFSSTYSAITLARGTTIDLKGSALTLVNGGAYTPTTGVLSINGSTLTVDGTVNHFDTGSTLTLAQGGTLAFSDGALKSTDGGILSFTTTSDFGLSGSLDDLSIQPNATTGLLHVKGTVTLHNTSRTSLKNVTATVYLSEDNLLSADDAQLLTLNLSDLVEKGKIGKGKTLSLPLKHKVPSVYANYFDGKYLIVILNADNLGSLASTPVVIGPLNVP